MTVPSLLLAEPKFVPPLHRNFRPASLGDSRFRKAVKASGKGVPLAVALERPGNVRSVYRTDIFPPSHADWPASLFYAERVVKCLLWQRGGYKLTIGGPPEMAEYFRKLYCSGGGRAFDAELMARVYEKPFEVEASSADQVPAPRELSVKKGGHLDGCRIGFDAGASDRKVAAVVDGKAVWSEEVIWNPKEQKDPQYHFDGILAAMKAAATHMPRVDAIGVSSAGIYVNNRAMVASLFRGVPPDLFDKRVKNIFLDVAGNWPGVPVEVANDGDVTALAGAMNLGEGAVLGIAMGSSQAAGYVTPEGTLTDWLSELAFVPVDYHPEAPVDEWSGDAGCGVQYFSQVAAIRLATAAGLNPAGTTPAEKLKSIQGALAQGDQRAAQVFESIGCFLGYSVAHYADFYDIRHMLVLGRVVSGAGGEILMKSAREVLKGEFPAVAERVKFHLPEEEAERRVGQAVAAASLPEIKS